MKKSVSFMLALMAVASMSLSAFAQELDNHNDSQPDIQIQQPETEAPEAPPSDAKAGLSFGVDADSQKGFDHLLTPGEVYRFPVLITDEKGQTVPVTEEHLNDMKLRVESKEGRNAVQSVKVVEDRTGYMLEVHTVSGYPTKNSPFKGVLKMVKKTNGQLVHSADISFQVGYASISNEALEAAKAGEYVYIEDSTPVITADQFQKLDRYTDGGKVTFTNGKWTYEVRVTEQGAVNMINNQRAIKEIAAKFEDQNFKFVSFPAGPTFDFTGKLTIDVSDEMEDFDGEFYVYSYYKGKLSAVDAKLDKESESLSFSTKTLGRFVITDQEIKNGTVIEEGLDNEKPVKPDTSKPGSGKPNPDTGAGSMGSVAAALSALSAGALGFLTRRKK